MRVASALRRLLAPLSISLCASAMASACFSPRPYPGPGADGGSGGGSSHGCQKATDCHEGSRCTHDGCVNGECKSIVDAVSPSDADPCTADSCDGAKENHDIVPKKSCGANSDLMCTSLGVCAGCTTDAQCGAADDCLSWNCDAGNCKKVVKAAGTPCSQGGVCDSRGICTSCFDKFQNNDETDIDCGGSCAKLDNSLGCAQGQFCDADSDCIPTLVCTGGVCAGGK